MKIYVVFESDYDDGYEIYDGKAFLDKTNAEAFAAKSFNGDVFEYEIEDVDSG